MFLHREQLHTVQPQHVDIVATPVSPFQLAEDCIHSDYSSMHQQTNAVMSFTINAFSHYSKEHLKNMDYGHIESSLAFLATFDE